jgi:antitoxin ParD1/3/4
MKNVLKTITLTIEQNDWMKAQIEAGHYADDNECIRDLIQREQERAPNIEGIRAALLEGEASGPPAPFDVNDFKQRMLAKHG